MIKESLEWIRVSKSNPCTQCNKPDWCIYTETGIVLCMRVPSDKPSKGKAGGWIHGTGKTTKILISNFKKPAAQSIDFESMFQLWQKKTEPRALMDFSASLGVEPMALHMIGCAQSPEGNWGMAMRNSKCQIIGIQIRMPDSSKRCVTGSRAGLFIPYDHDPREPLIITEGCSDCAAALSIGFSSIGRFNCSSQESMVNEFIFLKKIKEVIIVSDKDQSGMEGALNLQSSLSVKSIILVLPCKDMREFVRLGGTKKMMENLVRGKVWNNPK